MLEAWIDMEIELWECDAGLFAWLINDEGKNCGLETYKFKGHLIDFPELTDILPILEKSGEFLPNTCGENRPNYSGVYSGDVVEEVIETDPAETTDTPIETTALDT